MFYINYVICKLEDGKITSSGGIKFYINYVICKFGLKQGKIAKDQSFILTMWYVNSNLVNI